MKITVGTDEYCSVCKDWEEYDEDGKCKVCGTPIRKTERQDHTMVNEFDLRDFDGDSSEE